VEPAAGRHIVVAVDDSDDSEEACRWCMECLSRPGDTVHVLHVVPVMTWRTVYSLGPDGIVSYIPPVDVDVQRVAEAHISKRWGFANQQLQGKWQA
jgi:nucleotide-binding universal stress UspA family protein